MSLLFRLIRAVHANGTHHKLALDALCHLESPQSEHWQRLFLEHVDIYLEGAKAPDVEFKDFRNHVQHVRDGYWGGAVDKAENWYGHLVTALSHRRWSEAVYAAGVLSHYLTDPLHPFHTQQSEAENNIHRAVEWSIARSYDALQALGRQRAAAIGPSLGTKAGWLRDLMCRGAETANAHYERLIAHYDIHRGVVDPPSGLDPIAKGVIAELLVLAVRTQAAVLDRAIAEARAEPPEVNLTADTVLAALKVPVKWVTRRLADAQERRLIERMYDELMTTGRVEQNLPADDRTVRELHRADVMERQAAALLQQRGRIVSRAAAKAVQRKPTTPAKAPPARAGLKTGTAGSLASQLQKVATPKPESAPAAAGPPAPQAPMPQAPVPQAQAPKAPVPQAAPPRAAAPPAPAPAPAKPSVPTVAIPIKPKPAVSVPTVVAQAAQVPRGDADTVHLAPGDDLEKAPSIGPKTALRFQPFGIKTVADFLAADPADISAKVATRYITPQIIVDWQDQARLVMRVPGLRGTHAQLLVGARFRTVDAIANATPDALYAAIRAFAATPDGQHVLRDGKPPDAGRVKSWCANARQAKAA